MKLVGSDLSLDVRRGDSSSCFGEKEQMKRKKYSCPGGLGNQWNGILL